MPHIPHTILITGASSGLGAALACTYAEAGCVLMLTGRHEERLEQTADLCRSKGAIVHSCALDVTDKAALLGWIEAMDKLHPIELVIANAGISGGTSGTTESSRQTENIFATNVDGMLNTL